MRTKKTIRLIIGVFILTATISGGWSTKSAYAACATPTAAAGALEWFVADLKFKYCDGTNWNFLGTGGLWTLNGANAYYSTGNVGIGVTNPVVAMDVNGSIRMGSSGATCNSTYEGTMRFNSTTDQVQVCDGTAWKSIAGTAVSSCALTEYTTPGNYSYTVQAGCTNLQIEAYGAGGGAANAGQGGGGGGSSRVDNGGTTLALGGGGGGGSYDTSTDVGGGGGGGYGKKVSTITAGTNLTVVVGGGGQNGCTSTGGPGGSPSGGTGGNTANGGDSTYGGAGGGDQTYRGGSSTHGGGGGGGTSVSNSASTTTNGGAGATDPGNLPCGATTNGGTCGGIGEGGGGGYGIGDVALQGLAGDQFGGGTAANGGPGTGATDGPACPTGGGNGKVVIRPL